MLSTEVATVTSGSSDFASELAAARSIPELATHDPRTKLITTTPIGKFATSTKEPP